MITQTRPKNLSKFPASARRLIKRADQRGDKIDLILQDNGITKHFEASVITKNAYGKPAVAVCVWKQNYGKRARFVDATGFNRYGRSERNSLADVHALLDLGKA
jgi:hypothetical protein